MPDPNRQDSYLWEEFKPLFGCLGKFAAFAVSVVVAFYGTWYVCRYLSWKTGEIGYVQAGWVFVLPVWVVLYVAIRIAWAAIERRRRDRLPPRGFPLDSADDSD